MALRKVPAGNALAKPVFYLLAGPNGAGKSSLYRALVKTGTIAAKAEFVNADLHEAAHLQHVKDSTARSEQARLWADQRRAELLQKGESFASETVFSHQSKITLIEQAKVQGFLVLLLVVALDEPQTLVARVAQRVKEGGHAVPKARLLARYPRTMANLARAVRIADAALLYDAQEKDGPTQTLVATCKGLQTQVLVSALPQWAQRVLYPVDPGASA